MPSLRTGSRSLAWLASIGLAAAIPLSGCSTDRAPITDPALDVRYKQWEEFAANEQLSVSNRVVERIKKEQDDYAAGKIPSPPIVDILALSGGGDYGAFGAGFLNGWGTVTEPGFTRPEFDVVTGVSTGSLIAPFAFVGTAASYERIETLYRNPQKDWVVFGGFFSLLPGNSSLMEITGLKKSLAEAVNMDFVREVAAQADKSRVLGIGSTNEDLGVQRIFDLGQEANDAIQKGNIERFQNMMLASSAIPAAFPPVEIDGYLYGDGGVTSNVLIRLDANSARGVLRLWRERYPNSPLPHFRYWVIFNNQTQTVPTTVQPSWVKMAARTLDISIRSATMAQIRLVAAQIDDMNARGLGTGEMYMTSIPNEWRPPVEGTFQKPTMDSLADLGRKMGADTKSWRLLTQVNHPK